MKRILFTVLLFSVCSLASTPSLYAQSKHKVYREIWTKSNCFNTILSMELVGKEEIDLFKIVDENENRIKFSSTSDAMTYLVSMGGIWKVPVLQYMIKTILCLSGLLAKKSRKMMKLWMG